MRKRKPRRNGAPPPAIDASGRQQHCIVVSIENRHATINLGRETLTIFVEKDRAGWLHLDLRSHSGALGIVPVASNHVRISTSEARDG